MYSVGDGVCIDCIIDGANRIDNTNRLGGTTKCEKAKKMCDWANYLLNKARATKEHDMVNMTIEVMINMIITKVYTGKDIIQSIMTVITSPNDTWAI